MFIKVIAEKHNVFFECDRVIETEEWLHFMQGDEIFVQLIYADEEKLKVYAMNDIGRTVNSWSIFPEGRKE